MVITVWIIQGILALMFLYDISRIKRNSPGSHPDLKKLRRILFWDRKMENIDWEKQKVAVIKRVFERGNEIEKKEILRFYGKRNVNRILKNNED